MLVDEFEDHFGWIFAVDIDEYEEIAGGVSQSAFQRSVVPDIPAHRDEVRRGPGFPDFLDLLRGPIDRGVVQKQQVNRIGLRELLHNRADSPVEQRYNVLFVMDGTQDA